MAQERITSLEDLNAFGTEQPDGLWRSPGGCFFYPDGVMEQARRPNFRGLVLGGIDADFYR